MTDIKQLERELAYSAARSDIDFYCARSIQSGRYYGTWYFREAGHREYQWYVDRAFAYLEARNLLRRHPEMVELVQVLDDENSDG
ncbi:MAG TPA: hypothetical protein ENK38_05195 [Gammaproteobacteria bacterium]|nr:hypothetical protein [Gammaproteobacteria bacterium]